MADLLAYPDTLPGPNPPETQSVERRLISETDGVRVTRPIQRDRQPRQRLTFDFLSFEHSGEFIAWWRDTLTHGGAWFKATWPLPQGWVPAARKFIGVPQREYVPAVGWRVSATFEVRGRGAVDVIDGGGGGGGGGGDGLGWLLDWTDYASEPDAAFSQAESWPWFGVRKPRAAIINPAGGPFVWTLVWTGLNPDEDGFQPTGTVYVVTDGAQVFDAGGDHIEIDMHALIPEHIFGLPQGVLRITVEGVPGALELAIGPPDMDGSYNGVAWGPAP